MKKLVMFGGPPCTGKSSVAALLGEAHLAMDEARMALLPDAAHTRADRMVAYRAIHWAAGKLLASVEVVICDGGYVHEEDRAACRAVADAVGASFYTVEFTAPLGVLLERNRRRRAHHPGLDLTDARVAEIVAAYPWSRAGIVVDGTEPMEKCADAVRAYLQTDGDGQR